MRRFNIFTSLPLRNKTLLAASLGMFLDGYDLSIMAIALLPLRQQFLLSSSKIGFLMAMALIGSLFGGLLGGGLIDRFGRKHLLLPNVALYLIGALISAFAYDLSMVYLGRLITGIAVGLDYPLAATIVAEFALSDKRGRSFSGVNLSWYAGALCSTFVGWLLLSLGQDAWRIMFASALVPGVLLYWMRHGIPESPRWLIRKGYGSEAKVSLRSIVDSDDPILIQRILNIYQSPGNKISSIFEKKWVTRLILGIIPWFILDVVALGLALYFPLVLRQLHIVSTSLQAAGINSIYVFITTFSVVLGLNYIDRWGRITLQKNGFLLIAIGLFLFGMGIIFSHLLWVFIGALFYAIGLGFGPGVTSFALAVELFPTEYRASIGGIATASSRFGAILSAILFPIYEKSFGVGPLILVMSFLAVFAALITNRFSFETAQMELEEIEKL